MASQNLDKICSNANLGNIPLFPGQNSEFEQARKARHDLCAHGALALLRHETFN